MFVPQVIMNDPDIFANFIGNIINVMTAWTRNAITKFIPTFTVLLSTTDEEITTFVTSTHSSNSARVVNNKILISLNVVISLQSMLFELKARELCDELPDQVTLQGITPAHVEALQRTRATAIEHKKKRKAAKSTSMTIPTFKGSNYDEFIAALYLLVSREFGVNDYAS